MSGAELADSVAQAMQKQGFVHRVNRGNNVTEFEVTSPCHLLVRVEDLTARRVGLGLRSGVRFESAIEIVRTIGATEPEGETRAQASSFLDELRTITPPEPWKGLGFTGSRREKSNWERLGDL